MKSDLYVSAQGFVVVRLIGDREKEQESRMWPLGQF